MTVFNMGYSLKKESHRKYAYILFCVIIFDYLLYPLPIFAQTVDFAENQCVPEVLSADSSVAQTLVIENTIKAAEVAKTAKVVTIKEADKKKIVRAAVFERQPEIVFDDNDSEKALTATTTASTTSKVVQYGYHSMTAYNSEVGQTDNSPCITANGFDVCKHGIEDTIAANFLPFGTKVRIPDMFGDRIFIVRDRMNRRYSERVDVWFKSRADAMQFGVRTLRIEVVK